MTITKIFLIKVNCFFNDHRYCILIYFSDLTSFYPYTVQLPTIYSGITATTSLKKQPNSFAEPAYRNTFSTFRTRFSKAVWGLPSTPQFSNQKRVPGRSRTSTLAVFAGSRRKRVPDSISSTRKSRKPGQIIELMANGVLRKRNNCLMSSCVCCFC